MAIPTPESVVPARSQRGGGSLICAALIAAAVVLAWCNTVSAPFELDDQSSIVENTSIRDFWSLNWLNPPATAGETVSGRPVLNLSFAVNYAIGGLSVGSYHVGNIVIHILASLALFGLVRRTLALPRVRESREIGGRALPAETGIALAVALIWALHPLQTGAVTYVVQRAESLCGLFYLFTLYAFARGAAAQTRGVKTNKWCILSAVSCLLAVGTKEVAATAPLVVLLYDRVFVAGTFRTAWRARSRTHLALAATWLVLAVLVIMNHDRGGSVGSGASIDAFTYLVTQAWAIVRYLGLALWPVGLVFDYGVPTVGHITAVLPQFLLLGALVVAAAWALWKNKPAGFLGVCFFLLLAPSSSVVPVATQTVAEHRMYLPLAALVILAVLVIRNGLERLPVRLPAWLLVGIVAVALGAATFARNRVYGSAESLWRDTVEKRPENARAHNNLGLALSVAGRPDEAMGEFERAIDLQPNHAFAHFNLGNLLTADGRWEEAASHYRAALEADPGYVSARVNLGQALQQLGRPDEAITQYEKAIAEDPGANDARTNLAALLIDSGRPSEAISMLHTVIAVAPDIAEAHYHLGRALEKSGARPTEVEDAYQTALRLKPGMAVAHLALGNCLAKRGDAAGAEHSFREALRLDAALVEAHFALGNLLAEQRKFEAAMAEYREALEHEPAHAGALNNLGNCQLVTGRYREAEATYLKVLGLRPDDETVRKNLEVARELQRGGAPSGG